MDNQKRRSETVFDKCAYRDCRNGRFSTGAHLFRFPSGTDDRRYKLWIHNSGKFLHFLVFILYCIYIVCVKTESTEN